MRLIIFSVSILLFSCGSESETNKENTKPIESTNENIDTLKNDDDIQPGLINDFKILTNSSFHGDEIEEGLDTNNWYEIYTKDNNYYLSKTSITFEKSHDPFLDENEFDITGVDVSSKYKEYSVLLIQTSNLLEEKKMNYYKIEKTFFYPNEKLNFTFLDNNYTFYAKGITKENEYSMSPTVKNYEFYISTMKNDKEITQKIGSEEYFSESEYSIIFIGDIDGDDKLDLIIDLTYHYNVSIPTLFLSSFANDDEIFVKVAEHRSVGC